MPFERIGHSSSSSIEMLVSKLNIAIDDNYQVVGTISPNKITDKKEAKKFHKKPFKKKPYFKKKFVKKTATI